MERDFFLALSSWSVNYNGVPFDDARHGEDGIWFYRDIITHEILRFPMQDHVVEICENPFNPPTDI